MDRLYEEGRVLMDAGKFGEAADAFSKSLAADLPHFKTLELLGECYAKLGRWADAVVPLAAATTLNRQSRAPALLAEVFEHLNRPHDALAMARLALDRSSDNKRALGVLQRIQVPPTE